MNTNLPYRRAFVSAIAILAMVSLAVLSVYAIVLMGNAAASFRAFSGVPLARVEWLSRMEFAVAKLGQAALSVNAVEDFEGQREQLRVFEEITREYNSAWDAVRNAPTTNQDGNRLRSEIDRTGAKAVRMLREYIDLSQSPGNIVSRRFLQEDLVPAQREWAQAIEAYADAQGVFVAEEVDRTIAQVHLGALLIGAVAGAALIFVGTSWFYMNRSAMNLDARQDRQRSEQLRKLAYYDHLTNLPNRLLVEEHVEAVLAKSGQCVSLVCFDLDDFKEINDALGHATGDAVLKELARRLMSVVTEGDLLGRFGGDEFVLIHHCASGETGEGAANRLMMAMRPEICIGSDSFSIRASFGIATAPKDATSFSELLRCADLAMYEAKGSGGGLRTFSPAFSDRLRSRAEIADELRRALGSGAGLSIHYQPKFELSARRLQGAEALVRWSHPAKGAIPPGVFVAVAEERGLILDLGDWVFRNACQQLRLWKDLGLELPGRLAINVSAKQLESPGLAERLNGFAADAGVSATNIEIELTESSLVNDVVNALSVLKQLRKSGFTVAIDDFGTGFSSLAYLKRLEADHIKIDMAFVQSMLNSRVDYAIVESVISMSRALGMQTVAEGVETDEQCSALERLGCPFAQGFLFGRAVDPIQFRRLWLESSAPGESFSSGTPCLEFP